MTDEMSDLKCKIEAYSVSDIVPQNCDDTLDTILRVV